MNTVTLRCKLDTVLKSNDTGVLPKEIKSYTLTTLRIIDTHSHKKGHDVLFYRIQYGLNDIIQN